MATEGRPISDLTALNSLAGEVYLEAIRRASPGDKFTNVRVAVELLKGLQGEAGADGKDGASAFELAVLAGFEGSAAQWLESLKGPQGEKGADGVNGADGLDGSDGAPGVDGKDGIDGQDGADGAQGPKGDQGAVGPQGPQGSIGPKGDTGDTGPQGPQGPEGPAGAAGESAYELAVRLGDYIGEEAAFIDWLKAADGTAASFSDEIGLPENQWKPVLVDFLDAVNNSLGDGFVYYQEGSLAVQVGKKEWVGLGNVDNTSDLDKPISNAVAQALANKVTSGQLTTALTGLLSATDVVDDLTSTDPQKALSANQGRLLKESFDTLADVFGDTASMDEIMEAVQFILNNREALDNLEIQHVAGLQAALDALSSRADALETLTAAHQAEISKITTLETAQQTLTAQGADHEERLQLLELDDGGSTDPDPTLEPRLTEIESRLTTLEAIDHPDHTAELDSIRSRLTTLENAGGGGDGGVDHSVEIAAIEDRLLVIESTLGNKVDKEVGKGLSTNDYTNDHRDAVQDLIDNPITPPVPYVHPTGFDVNGVTDLTGSAVISGITVNQEGHLTGVSTRNLTPADIGAAAEGSGGGGGGEPTAGGAFVRKRIVIMRGSLEAIVLIVGFGSQADMDQVTATEFDNGTRVQIDNKPEGLMLYSVSLYYDDGWNEGTAFRLEYPDNWGDTFMGDMVLPMMIYYLRGNPPTIQPFVNISYGHENGFNSVTKVNITAGRGYHWRYSFV